MSSRNPCSLNLAAATRMPLTGRECPADLQALGSQSFNWRAFSLHNIHQTPLPDAHQGRLCIPGSTKPFSLAMQEKSWDPIGINRFENPISHEAGVGSSFKNLIV